MKKLYRIVLKYTLNIVKCAHKYKIYGKWSKIQVNMKKKTLQNFIKIHIKYSNVLKKAKAMQKYIKLKYDTYIFKSETTKEP